MAWRGALSRSLMPTSRASAFRTLTPCSAPPRLHSASVSSSCSRLPFIDTALRPSQQPSSFRFLFSNPSTLGQLGCIPSPLHSMVAGARMTSHYAIKMSDKRNISDHKRRLLSARYELRRKLYKALCKDPNLPNVMREKVRYKLSKLPRKSSFTRVRNRCIYSGRPRGVYRLFRMSRIVFRGLANHGQLMGVKKSSW